MTAEEIITNDETCTCALAVLEDLATKARSYADNAKSSATKRAYTNDFRDFSDWCEVHSLAALPAAPSTVVLYISAMAEKGHKPATLSRRLASISVAHQAARIETPTRSIEVRITMQGIRRQLGTAQREAAPVTTEVLRKMCASMPTGLAGVRDRALLLVGFAGAFRRSELVSLNLEDLTFADNGLEILLRRSKTDQEGAGVKVAIPYGSKLDTCPVRSLRAWIDAAGITSGPVFVGINRHAQTGGRLTGRSVALVVKRYADRCGLDSTTFSGHSLRAGLVTSAAAAGVQERVIMRQSRHKGLQMVRKYIRDGDLWRENAAAEVGL